MYKINSTFVKKSAPAGYIEESDAYIGVFTKAKKVTSKGGAKGVEFDFKADDDSVARRLTIWTHGRSGDHINGIYAINALMACLRIREVTPRAGQVEEYNWDTRQTEVVPADIYPDLMNKVVGVVLQQEEYEGRDQYGETVIRTRLQIVHFFEAQTRLTGVEIINGTTTPAALDKFMRRIEMNPVRKLKKQTQQSAPAPAYQDTVADDYIPF